MEWWRDVKRKVAMLTTHVRQPSLLCLCCGRGKRIMAYSRTGINCTAVGIAGVAPFCCLRSRSLGLLGRRIKGSGMTRQRFGIMCIVQIRVRQNWPGAELAKHQWSRRLHLQRSMYMTKSFLCGFADGSLASQPSRETKRKGFAACGNKRGFR